MPIAVYQKAPLRRKGMRHAQTGLPLLPTILMILGSLLIGSVAGPIFGYLLITAPRLQSNTGLISPIASTKKNLISPLTSQVLAAPIVYQELDYRNPENWFPGAQFPTPIPSKITHYNLSIPKLGITNAVVEISGSDLGKSLIHYPGTANPGEFGSPVIFGHSILRQFYNPKNYMSIFSTIMTLTKGDEITINFDGVEYTYRVIDKLEVKPTDVQILEQRYNGRFLKLVTCVPEGTYLRRGIVIAELEQN